MKIIFLPFLIVTVILLSCTYNHRVRPTASANQASLNERGLRQTATVTLVNEQKFNAEKLRFAPDSTSWVDVHTQNVITVKTTEISNIRFLSRGKGAVEGLGIGLLAGTAIGVAVGFADGDDPEGDFTFFALSAEQKAMIGGILFGVIGGVVGLPVGVAVGSKVIYHVGPDSLQSKALARK